MTEFSGSGDPARSMALLWRTTERAGRSGLSVDRIVTAAIAVADEEGIGALTMRRVAERLGVGTMSIYTHVPSKAELIDVMLDTVLAEVAEPDTQRTSSAGTREQAGSWRERLARIAYDLRALYLRHPWLLQVATARPPMGPNVIAKYEHELRAVDGIGLTDVEMDAALTLVLGHAEGAARRAVEASQTEQHSGLTDEQWWEASAPLLAKVFDASRFPVAARVGAAAGEAHNAAFDPQHAFEFGLQRILDGIEALVRARSER
jgi:AcrR family transcriptional regulator